MAETAIRIENLTKRFGSVSALEGLSLEVPSGIIFGFLGPNGAGKTTTIRLLLGLLEPTAGRVQVLFVTVDPTRDTPELLRNYVPAFNPSFLGLYGDAGQTAKVTKDFRIYAAQRPGSTPQSYTVDHSAQTLVFDPQGKLRLVFAYGMAADKMAADLKVLLNNS